MTQKNLLNGFRINFSVEERSEKDKCFMRCDIWFIKFKRPLGEGVFALYLTTVRVLGRAGEFSLGI